MCYVLISGEACGEYVLSNAMINVSKRVTVGCTINEVYGECVLCSVMMSIDYVHLALENQ